MFNPKLFTCSICGEQVSKRGSLHIGNGKRACREHQETFQKSVEAKQRENPQKQVKRNRKNNQINFLTPSCSICNQTGLPQDIWYTKVLIEWQKWEFIHGKSPNIFDPVEIKEASGFLADTPCLYYVSWKGKNSKIKIPFRAYQIASFIGQLFVCPSCLKEYEFETIGEERIKNIKPGDLSKLGLLAEVVRPELRKLAEKEMKRDN